MTRKSPAMTVGLQLRQAGLEELCSGAACISTLVAFTLVELLDHQIISGRNGAWLFHFLAFYAIVSNALAPLSMKRWARVLVILIGFGALLENVEIVKTAPFDLLDVFGEVAGAAVGAVTVVCLRAISTLGGQMRASVAPSSPTANALFVALAGALWLFAVMTH